MNFASRSRHGFELELGPQLGFYRRRSELEVQRAVGLSMAFYFAGPFFAAMLAFYLTFPIFYLAKRAGAVPPLWKDPTYGPLLIGWFAICFLALLWFMYVAPRLVFLAVHEDGFVVKGLFKHRIVRFRDIVECQAINSTATLSLQLADKKRLSWKGFYNTFPPEGVEQLLNLIATRKTGVLQVSEIDHGFKRRIRMGGFAMGLVMLSIVAITPVRDEKGRAFLHKAFGARFCGLPSEISVPLFFALLFAPLVLVCPHAMILQGRRMGLTMFRNLYTEAEARRSLKIAVAGLVYFVALVAALIAYTALHGL